MYQPNHSEPISKRTQNWQLQRQRNARMGWALASIAGAFFVGFLAKLVLLGG